MFDVEDGDREATTRRAADRFANWNIALAKRVRDFSAASASASVSASASASASALHAPSNGRSHETADEPPDAATVLFYSAHKTLTTILDDPTGHDFPPTDVSKMEGAIWAGMITIITTVCSSRLRYWSTDHLHPTSRVHDFWARDLGAFLSSVKPYEKHPGGDIEANAGHGMGMVRTGH